ncbi:MAG: hypothetical protein ABSE49_20645, partial [Polyangiaceae bacterium]
IDRNIIQGPRAVGPVISAIQRLAEQQGLRSPVVVTPEEGRTMYSMDPEFFTTYSNMLRNEAAHATMLATETEPSELVEFYPQPAPLTGPTGPSEAGILNWKPRLR